MKRLPFPLLALLLALGGAGVAWHFMHRADAYKPPDVPVRQAEVMPTSEFMNVRASIDHYQERILRQPEVASNYVALAQVYLQQARVTADEKTYVPRARDLIEEALQHEPDHFHALVLKASLLATLHQFEQAKALTETLLAQYPHNAFTYGILVDALVELGAYDDAVQACDRMLSLRPGVASYARAAYLRELHGDVDGAVQAMEMAADAGLPGREDRSWALYQLGSLYLKQGQLDKAAFVFDGILQERPGYAYALGGLAHIKRIERDYPEARRLYAQAYDTAPNAHFLEGLAEVYGGLGDGEALAATLKRIEQSFHDAEAMGENVRMEYADFLADHDLKLEEALRLAQLEYQRRPDHLHALETYAWALHKNGRSAEAVPHIERAMRLNTQDAMVLYRAALIYRGAGRTDLARDYLQQALAAHLHVESGTAAETARHLLPDLEAAS